MIQPSYAIPGDTITDWGVGVNSGRITFCPTGDTTKLMMAIAPAIVHIFFSIVLNLSSTLRISLSHPALISVLWRLTSLWTDSIFSNNTASILSCLSYFSSWTASICPILTELSWRVSMTLSSRSNIASLGLIFLHPTLPWSWSQWKILRSFSPLHLTHNRVKSCSRTISICFTTKSWLTCSTISSHHRLSN